MGRPLRKDVFGTDVIGTGAGAATGIRVEFYDTQLRTDGVIIKQRGATSFLVCQVGNIGTTSTYKTCKLVNTQPNAAGEMRIMGYVGGNGANNVVPIAKLTRRIAYGYPSVPVLSTVTGEEKYWRSEDATASTNHDQTKYTWYLENDSSADIIVLTAITSVM